MSIHPPDTHQTTAWCCSDENVPPTTQQTSNRRAVISTVADGPKSRRASLPRDVSLSSNDSPWPCRRGSTAAPSGIERRHSLPNDDALAVWPCSLSPCRAASDAHAALLLEPQASEKHKAGTSLWSMSSSPQKRAQQPGAPGGPVRPQLSAFNLHWHNQKMAAEEGDVDMFGDRPGGARRRLSLGQYSPVIA
jgi:hypothetical protein